jgi:glycosyltransferase involved in cell wall biosynthesis
MNITLICNEYPPLPQGGIGTFTYHYARALAAAGHDITVVCVTGGPLECRDGDVRVVFLGSDGSDASAGRHLLTEWLTRDVQLRRTDIVETPEFEGMAPSGSLGCPVVVRLHQSMSGILLNRLRPPWPSTYYYERETLRRHRHWIAVSKAVLRYTCRVFLMRPGNAEVIYNFAPPSLHPAPNDIASLRRAYGDYAVFVGKLTSAKGALDLAHAARTFLHEFRQLKLVYLGQDWPGGGKMMSARIREAAGDDVSHRILFPGALPHSDAMAWVGAARVFVLPSRLEAFSMAPLEAMRLRVPVVYTNRCSGPEVIDDGKTGLLVDPSQPQQIAAAVGRVLSDPVLASELVSGAEAALASRFSLERCVGRSLRFYQQVLGRRAGLAAGSRQADQQERECSAV